MRHVHGLVAVFLASCSVPTAPEATFDAFDAAIDGQAPPPTIALTTVGPAVAGEPLGVVVQLPVPRDDLTVYLATSDGGTGAGPCPAQLRGRCLGIVGHLSGTGPLAFLGGRARTDVTLPSPHPSGEVGLQAVVLYRGQAFLSPPIEVPVTTLPHLDRTVDLDGSVTVTLASGPGGLDEVEHRIAATLDEVDPSTLLPPNPFYSNSNTACANPCSVWGGDCTTCTTTYAVDLNLDGVSFAGTTVDLQPQASGSLYGTITIADPVIDWSADGTVTAVSSSASGSATASSIVVTAFITPSVSGGVVTASVSDVHATIQGFSFSISGFLGTVLDFFGVRQLIADRVETELRDAVTNGVTAQLPGAVEDFFGEMSFAQHFDLASPITGADVALDFSGSVEGVTVDASTLRVDLQANAAASAWTRTVPAEGSLYHGFTLAPVVPVSGTHVGLSVDLVNRLLFEAWGGGLMAGEVALADFPLDPALLGTLPTGLDLRVTVDPTRPPEVWVDGATHHLWMRDIDVTIHVGPRTDNVVVLEARSTFEADLLTSVPSGAVTGISLALSNPDIDTIILGQPAANQAVLDSFDDALVAAADGVATAIVITDLTTLGTFGMFDATTANVDGFITLDGRLADLAP
ncbi:MAG: hypothetical protein H6733_14125 [Alphaproteobacteria bacterium]|nr:hypothetical protein [Alphaproteobacteria bacterium]